MAGQARPPRPASGPEFAMKNRKAAAYRLLGVCFFLGAVLVFAAFLGTKRPPFLLSAGLQLVAWFSLVTHANRLERRAAPGGRRQPVRLR